MKDHISVLLTLLTLAVGITIGILIAPRFEHQVVSAQSSVSQAQQAQTGPKVTPVTPMMSGGSAGFYLILSHQMQTDQAIVNGYDLMKLANAELGLLSKFVPAAEVQKAVDSAKASEVFTLAQPEQPANSPAKPPAK